MNEGDRDPRDLIGSDLVKEDGSFVDIVMQFVEGLSGRLAKMEEAMRAVDFEALRVAAHQLKGSGGGYGYPLLTERAKDLEVSAKNRALDDCADALAELKEVCRRIVVDADA
jgi:HPt (histidine-containing phosphotransfer) domain-containing protein